MSAFLALSLLLARPALAGQGFEPVRHVASAPAARGKLSAADERAIREKIEEYVQAFVRGDEAFLKSSCTERYIEDQGGWEHFRELLAKFKDKWSSGAHASAIRILPGDPGTALAHYDIRGRSGILASLESSMLALKKEGGVWKLDHLVPDAYPGSK